MANMQEILAQAIEANDMDGDRMCELVSCEDGPLKLAKMCDGYEEMSNMDKVKMMITSSVILAAWKLKIEGGSKRPAQEELEPGSSPKRAARDEAEDISDPEPYPIIPDEQQLAPEPKPEPKPEAKPDPDPLPQPTLARSFSIDPRNGSGL